MNFNSEVNQRIKGKFVDREVLVLFSYPMLDVMEKMIITEDEIENLYYDACPNCGEELERVVTEDRNSNVFYCNSCEEEIEENKVDLNAQEVFEHWIVTGWLYEKLKEKGEPVVEWHNLYIWGRTCTGQAIMLDGVISGICSDLEILEGQQNSWER